MAASVRIEDEAFSDTRYDALAALAGLADADHARGKMIRLWRQCTMEHNHLVSEIDVIAVLGARGVDAILGSRLAERVSADGRCIRVKGTRGRIEWLKHLRQNGKRGGRPKKQERTKRKPSGLCAPKPDANPPAPAPAPVLLSPSGESGRKTDPLFDAIAAVTGSDPHTAGGHVAKVRKALAEASPSYTPEEVREFGRRFGEFCGWAKDGGRVRMPTVGEVEKYIGRVRAAPQADQDEAGRWEMGRKLAADKAAWEAAKEKPETEPDF